MTALAALAFAGLVLLVAVVGVLLLAGVALSGVVVGRFERWRTLLVDRDPMPDPHRRPEPGRLGWLRTPDDHRRVRAVLAFLRSGP